SRFLVCDCKFQKGANCWQTYTAGRMQLKPVSQDTWRHRCHGACLLPNERESPLTLPEPTISHHVLSPGDRRSYLLDNSSDSIQKESLAVPMGLEDSAPDVQMQQQPGSVLQELEEEEIAPTDVKYRLQLLEEAPLQKKSSSGHNQNYKPGWIPVSKTHREWFKPWKTEDVINREDEPSHSGHLQGRRTAPRGHLSHHTDQSTQHVSREMAPGWPPTQTHEHQEPSQTKQGTAITRTKRTVKFDEATTSRMFYLPPLKLPPRRVKSKWPPHTPGIFQAKFQTELSGGRFFQDWGAPPQGRHGSNEKPLVPFEDQANTRLTYMPLFTERVKLSKSKTNGIKRETNPFSTEQGKSIRQGFM
ncbi:hypothetical protein STEG23_003901, partial [Scotinomys teguina]